MEGPKRPTTSNNANHYTLHVREHLPRWNPHRLETHLRKPSISRDITRRTVAAIMRLTINLDAQPYFKAGEIEYEGIARELLAKLEPVRPSAKLLPQ